MARYRAEINGPTSLTGWLYRLEILDLSATLSTSVTDLPPGSVLEIGEQEHSFDEVPIGFMKPASLSVKLNWSVLPSGLKADLRQKESGQRRVVFILYTNRGSGSSYTCEFAGVPAQIAGATYATEENGDLSVTYDLVDALYYTFTKQPAEDVFYNGGATTPGVSTNITRVYDTNFPGAGGAEQYADVVVGDSVTGAKVTSFEDCMIQLQAKTSEFLAANGIPTTDVSVAPGNSVDFGRNLKKLVTQAVRYYRPATSYPRTASSTALTAAEIFLITHIYRGGTWIGGIFHPSDKYGWSQAEVSAWDVLRDLCESGFAKVSAKPELVAGADPYIIYTFSVDTLVTTSAATMSLDDAIEYSEIDEGGPSIGKAEVRIETESDKDVNESLALTTSRSDRSFNVEPIIHNVPAFKPDARLSSNIGGGSNRPMDFYSSGFYQTNTLLCTASGAGYHKVHEKTRAYYSSAEFIEVYPSDADSPPQAGPDASPPPQVQYLAWLATVQGNGCLHNAITEALMTTLGNEFTTTIDVTYAIGANALPSSLGETHTLTGGPTTELSHIAWDRAIVTSVKTNWLEGTSTLTYLCLQ